MDESAEQVQMGRKHVFVVNGSPVFLDLMREFFQDQRYNVTTTNFVPHTFDQIGALNPDLLLIDLVYGQQAGWDLLAHLQQEALTRDIPVIVVSTDPQLLEQAQAAQAQYGGRRWLAKPFDLDELVQTVAEMIGPA